MILFVYVLLCLVWGSTWIAIKIGLTDLPPLWASGLRFAVASLLLTGIVFIRPVTKPRSAAEWWRIAYPGLYIYAGSYAFIYFAELYISSALTAILFASFPFFVALLARYGTPPEPLATRGWIGLVIGFVGVIVISFDGVAGSPDLLLGSSLAVLGSLAAAYGVMLHKWRLSNIDIRLAAWLQISLGAVVLLVAALVTEPWSAIVWSPEAIGSLLYLAAFGSVLAFLAYYWLLRKSKAVTVSLIGFIIPIVATVIGVGFFDEQMSALVGVGAALVLIGVWIVLRDPAPRDAATIETRRD